MELSAINLFWNVNCYLFSFSTLSIMDTNIRLGWHFLFWVLGNEPMTTEQHPQLSNPNLFFFCLYLETGSYYVAKAGWEFSILLPLLPKCWDYRCVLPYLMAFSSLISLLIIINTFAVFHAEHYFSTESKI